MKLSIYIFLFLSVSVFSQEAIEVTFIKKTPLKAQQFVGVDNLESLYFIQENALVLQKKTDNFEFSNLQFGKITSANAFNPLKINVFYKDFNSVVILDNRLSEIFKIDFNAINPYKSLTHITTGNDNSIWLFNENTRQLENYDYKANKTRAQTMPIQGEVQALKSNFNYCWVLTKTHIYTYNYFGSLISKEVNEGFTSIEENNGNLYLLKQNSLFVIANGSDSIQKIQLPNLLIKQFLVTNETLYIYDDEFLHQYQLKTN